MAWVPWTTDTLAAHIRGEIAQDADASGGTTPARIENIIRECGIGLWNAADWQFRRKRGTLYVLDGESAFILPNDFGEFEQRWLKKTLEDEHYRLRIHSDPVEYQRQADGYDSDDTGEPRHGILERDTDQGVWVPKLTVCPTADDDFSWPYWFVQNDPWGRVPELTTALTGDDNDLRFIAKAHGSTGTDVTIEFAAGGAAAVAVADSAITVTYVTGVTTAAAVKVLFDADADAAALATCQNAPNNDGSGTISTAQAATALAGPIADSASPVWPRTFFQGWKLLSTMACQQAFRADDAWKGTGLSFKNWAQKQRSENDETVTTGDQSEPIIDGYGDLLALAGSVGLPY